MAVKDSSRPRRSRAAPKRPSQFALRFAEAAKARFGAIAEKQVEADLLKLIDEAVSKPVAADFDWLLSRLPKVLRRAQARKAVEKRPREDGLTRAIKTVLAREPKLTETSLPDELEALGKDGNALREIGLAYLQRDEEDGKPTIVWQDDAKKSAAKSAPVSGLKQRLLRVRRKTRGGRA